MEMTRIVEALQKEEGCYGNTIENKSEAGASLLYRLAQMLGQVMMNQNSKECEEI